MKLNKRDMRTMLAALEDALLEREEFLRCYKDPYRSGKYISGWSDVVKSTKATLKRYRALREKISAELRSLKERGEKHLDAPQET